MGLQLPTIPYITAQNIGIDAAGGYAANTDPALNYARNGVISGNTLYNIESKRGPLGGHGAIGIYVDGGRNVVSGKKQGVSYRQGDWRGKRNQRLPYRSCYHQE
jgi:hypothetical protein